MQQQVAAQLSRPVSPVDHEEALASPSMQKAADGHGEAMESSSIASMPDRDDPRCLEARAGLRRALRHRKTEELRTALKAAAAMSLYPVELQYAQEVLGLQRQRDALERMDQAQKKSSVKDLQAAIQEAEQLGVAGPRLENAKEALVLAKKQAVVRTELRKAAVSGDLQLLGKTLAAGEEVWLHDDELEPARQIYAKQSRISAALEDLSAALASRDLQALRESVAQGEAFCLHSPVLSAAQIALLEEERRREAWEKLRVAEVKRMCGRYEHEVGMQAVRSAIADCEDAGLESGPIETVAVGFREEERRDVLRQRLKVARERELLADFGPALAAAEAAGVSAAELATEREMMAETRKVVARRHLEEAIQTQDRGELTFALAEAKKAGLEEGCLTNARAALKSELMKEEARAKIARAVSRRMLLEIRAAVYAGECAQLSDAELEPSRQVLAAEELKHSAREAMEDASVSRDVVALKAAIKSAEAAGLQELDMSKAKGVLREELQAAANRSLGLAVRIRRTDALEEGIAAGVEVGLSEAELAVPRKLLNKLVRERGAIVRLREVKQQRNVVEIRKALEEEKPWAIGTAEFDHAQKVLAQEERKQQVRQTLAAACEQGEVEGLEKAVAAAELAGIPKKELEPYFVALSLAELHLATRRALRQALESSSSQELQAAVDSAVAARLSEQELEPARAKLTKLLADESTEHLAAALASRKVSDLEAAIANGGGCHDASLLQEATVALAEERLRDACRRKVPMELRRAIQEYEAKGLSELSADAEELLQEEERKVAARKVLEDHLREGNVDQLLSAISDAYAAGLEEWECAKAERILLHRRNQHSIVLAAGLAA